VRVGRHDLVEQRVVRLRNVRVAFAAARLVVRAPEPVIDPALLISVDQHVFELRGER
jgi:hypothetical protein